ncbi:cytochrome P450 [Crossiella equi]|uniref:Cytochrome P450 n=1 Tax=Crossiella equi TaxID=130796 RepID=A0ABS5AD21_9PSEU|nr:cytochrome P450 [Crossiella equi]MBP2474480.1 cytochrome P450 [Crossiella equi]
MATEDPGACPALHGAEFDANPYPAYDWLRRNAPVHRVDLPGGAWAWLVTRHSDAVAALVHPKLHKSPAKANVVWQRSGMGLPFDHRPTLARHMINADPPEHARLRQAVSALFSAQRMERLRERGRRITETLIREFATTGKADLIADLAYPLPVTIMGDLFGMSQSDRADFHRWAAVIDSAEVAAIDEVWGVTDALERYLLDLIASKREQPGDDLVSALVGLQDRKVLSADEVSSMVFLLLVAGHETTVSLIGNGLHTLLLHPKYAELARTDSSTLGVIMDEVLRYAGPVRNATWRFAVEPVTIGGQLVQPGDPVLISLLSANHDPEAFDSPEEFDPYRRDNHHLAFGHGPHVCVGQAMSRVLAEVAVGTVLRHFPDLRLAVPAAELRWWPSAIMRGLFELPVEFAPRTRP